MCRGVGQNFPYHSPLSTQQWWVPGGMKTGKIVNSISCRKCTEFSPEQIRSYKRDFQYQRCKLQSLMNSRGFQTINLHMYFFFTFFIPYNLCQADIASANSLIWSVACCPHDSLQPVTADTNHIWALSLVTIAICCGVMIWQRLLIPAAIQFPLQMSDKGYLYIIFIGILFLC